MRWNDPHLAEPFPFAGVNRHRIISSRPQRAPPLMPKACFPTVLPPTLGLILLLTFTGVGMGQQAGKAAGKPVGVQGSVGCRGNPKKVERLIITKPGVY